MIKGQDIICISTSDWNRPWGSKQQLMLRLSADNRVLYIEYQASFLHLFSPRFLFSRLKRRLAKINKNLFVFTPLPYLPFGYYFRVINKINQVMLLSSIRRLFKKLNFNNPIIWIYAPCSVDLLSRLNEKMILYHCIADFSAEKKNRFRTKTIYSMEKEVARKADVVLALTEVLYRRFREININTYLFPSAVDVDLFSSFLHAESEEPVDIANLKKPRIGFVGYLDKRIDIDLLCYLADQHPEWSLILVGPRIRYLYRLNLLAKRNNIHFLSEKKNAQIPMYIKSFDVCLIPYVVNEFTNNISPLKLYEYLTLGKPVVSTRLADLERFGDAIRVSDTREDFIRNISLSLQEKGERLVNERLDIAKKNSWGERLVTVSKLIEKRLREQRP